MVKSVDKKLEEIFYSERGFWKGKSAVKKLSEASGVGVKAVRKWLEKQPIYQIYLPAPKYIPRPNSGMTSYLKPNAIHQADLLFLPRDTYKKKTYRYALCVVDVASRYKTAYPLKTKKSEEVADGFSYIYEHTELKFPGLLVCDDGKEFYGLVKKLMDKKNAVTQRGDPSQHRSQGIVERFNRSLAERLFGYQYWKEMEDRNISNREWVGRLDKVVEAMNDEETRLIGLKPKDAVKMDYVKQGFSLPIKNGDKLDKLNVGDKVRYLYEPGELEGWVYKHGERRMRATDPIWSVDVFEIERLFIILWDNLICIG